MSREEGRRGKKRGEGGKEGRWNVAVEPARVCVKDRDKAIKSLPLSTFFFLPFLDLLLPLLLPIVIVVVVVIFPAFASSLVLSLEPLVYLFLVLWGD